MMTSRPPLSRAFDPQEQFALPDADAKHWLDHKCPVCEWPYSFLFSLYTRSVQQFRYHLECGSVECGHTGPEFKTSQDAIAHWRLAAKLSNLR